MVGAGLMSWNRLRDEIIEMYEIYLKGRRDKNLTDHGVYA